MCGIYTRPGCGLPFRSPSGASVCADPSISSQPRAHIGWVSMSPQYTLLIYLLAVEFVGYAARASAHNKTGKLMPYVIQNTFILLAPVLFAASIYMSLKKIIYSVYGEKYSIIRPTLLTKLFVSGDVLTLMVQGGAAGMMIVSSLASLAEKIVIAGLVLSILMFGLFWATAAVFHVRMRNTLAVACIPPGVEWERALFMLYAVSALIMIRSIFRVIEFILGTDGYPLTHEWTLYIFDSVPMLLVMVIFWYWFPHTLTAPNKRGSFQSVSSMAIFEPGPGVTGYNAHPTESIPRVERKF